MGSSLASTEQAALENPRAALEIPNPRQARARAKPKAQAPNPKQISKDKIPNQKKEIVW
jgi:hypothetical protein